LIRTTIAALIAFAVAFLPLNGNAIPLPLLPSQPVEAKWPIMLTCHVAHLATLKTISKHAH
jgi:hypothetical protein